MRKRGERGLIGEGKKKHSIPKPLTMLADKELQSLKSLRQSLLLYGPTANQKNSLSEQKRKMQVDRPISIRELKLQVPAGE